MAREELSSKVKTVRAEPVEALSFSYGGKEMQGFDKLSPSGTLCR
jgi:hypothetical protein